jgi:hypothetical protein
MTSRNLWTRIVVAALGLCLYGAPELIAQTATSPQTQTQAAPAQGDQHPQTPADPRFSGVKPDPAAGPQQPTLSPQRPDSQPALPNAPSAQPAAQRGTPATSEGSNGTQAVQRPTTQIEPPTGVATAEKGVTQGGAASTPAGAAIAPAKQRQVRSLLIKMGVVAAGAVAVGTVVGLSKGTPTAPPGSQSGTQAPR